MKNYLIGSAFALLFMQSSAFAYDYTYNEDPNIDGAANFYVGASAGLLAGDAADACDAHDLNCVSWKTFVGYRPTDQFALEGAYHHLFSGRSKLDSSKFESTGLSASALGIYPLKDNIDLFGKLGFIAWEARRSSTTTKISADGTDMMLGGGHRGSP